MRIIENGKLYQLRINSEYIKIYIYKLKKATKISECVKECFSAEALYSESISYLQDANVIDREYYNEEQYYNNNNNVFKIIIDDINGGVI